MCCIKLSFITVQIRYREALWLSGSAPDCCPAVPGSNPASPLSTADCQSSAKPWWDGTWLWGATEEKIMRNGLLGRSKHIKKKKQIRSSTSQDRFMSYFFELFFHRTTSYDPNRHDWKQCWIFILSPRYFYYYIIILYYIIIFIVILFN